MRDSVKSLAILSSEGRHYRDLFMRQKVIFLVVFLVVCHFFYVSVFFVVFANFRELQKMLKCTLAIFIVFWWFWETFWTPRGPLGTPCGAKGDEGDDIWRLFFCLFLKLFLGTLKKRLLRQSGAYKWRYFMENNGFPEENSLFWIYSFSHKKWSRDRFYSILVPFCEPVCTPFAHMQAPWHTRGDT